MDTTQATYYALGGLSALVLTFLLSQPTSFAKWVQTKKYQYEVTFSLYMLTPTEKFVFNSILFLFVALVGIACFVYLPSHLATIASRAFYYYAGEANTAVAATTTEQETTAAAQLLASTGTAKIAEAVLDATASLLQASQRAAVNTAVAAQEAVTGALAAAAGGVNEAA